MKRVSRLALIAALLGLEFCQPRPRSQAATGYGCFKVTASSLNIRARPYASAEVIGTASKGEILIKRKPCARCAGSGARYARAVSTAMPTRTTWRSSPSAHEVIAARKRLS